MPSAPSGPDQEKDAGMRLFGGSKARLVRTTVERDPYVRQSAAAAEGLGLRQTELSSAISTWRYPPLVAFGKLEKDSVLAAHAGAWRGRKVIVATTYQIMSTLGDAALGGRPDRALCYLQVAARIDAPAESMAWIAAAPAGHSLNYSASDPHGGGQIGMWATLPRLRGLFPSVGGYEVPAPANAGQWQVRAMNTRFAAMLISAVPELLAEMPCLWRIDDFDFVHITPKAAGAPPLTGDDLGRSLNLVCKAAENIEGLIHSGFGDRPFTPAWPPGSQVVDRFPDDVVAALRAAGWQPGRADGQVSEAIREFPAVAASVAEFGGLHIAHDPPGPGGQAGTFTLVPGRRSACSTSSTSAPASGCSRWAGWTPTCTAARCCSPSTRRTGSSASARTRICCSATASTRRSSS
jgi:SUKH-3 immunity protein